MGVQYYPRFIAVRKPCVGKQLARLFLIVAKSNILPVFSLRLGWGEVQIERSIMNGQELKVFRQAG